MLCPGGRRVSLSVCKRLARMLSQEMRRVAEVDVNSATTSYDSVRLVDVVLLTDMIHVWASHSKPVVCLPPRLHHYLFGDVSKSPNPDAESDDLHKLQLPPLEGNSLDEHFRAVCNHYDNYRELLSELCLDVPALDRIRAKIPTAWVLREGWTRYNEDGSAEPVDRPLEDALVFDVETCVIDGSLPTLAVAASTKAWYGWCAKRLVDPDSEAYPPPTVHRRHLIPLGISGRSRIAVGHNVGFDRVRVTESYDPQMSSTLFWDTMSMHYVMHGMGDRQATAYAAKDLVEEVEPAKFDWQLKQNWRKQQLYAELERWKSRVSMANLADVYWFHTGNRLDKHARNLFVDESIHVIRENFADLIAYCARDVFHTWEVYSRQWPLWIARFPHPATFVGQLIMQHPYLPTNRYWNLFYNECEAENNRSLRQVGRKIVSAARLLSSGQTPDDSLFPSLPTGPSDLWLATFDWTKKTTRSRTLTYHAWEATLVDKTSKCGTPVEELTEIDIKRSARVVSALFGLCWGPYPVIHIPRQGFGFLVPIECCNSPNAIAKKGAVDYSDEDWWTNVPNVNDVVRQIVKENIAAGRSHAVELDDNLLIRPVTEVQKFAVYRLPHPTHRTRMLNDPTGRLFVQLYSTEGCRTLWPTRFSALFDEVLKCDIATDFWKNYRDRFREEIVVWPEEDEKLSRDSTSTTVPMNTPEHDFYHDNSDVQAVIAPSVVPTGTLTRRSTHKLWMTTTSAKQGRAGTELKSMIQAPPGWVIVSADVDGEEQWLAALFGDAATPERMAGCTPFSNMFLAGDKADGTDLHSVVAKECGISRNDAKVLNYARLYGASEMQARQHLSKIVGDERASRIVPHLFKTTKGEAKFCRRLSATGKKLWTLYCNQPFKGFHVNSKMLVSVGGERFLQCDNASGHARSHFEWFAKQRGCGKTSLLYSEEKTLLWLGGYESATFNYLERAYAQPEQFTPVLKAKLGDALTFPASERISKMIAKRSIINWMVQSSGVDFLHLLLASIMHMCRKYDVPARYLLSVHDELHFMCPEQDALRLILIYQLSHLYVRAYFSQSVGIPHVPSSIAWFSDVAIDKVLRKSPDQSIQLPGDGGVVPPGKVYRMSDLLRECWTLDRPTALPQNTSSLEC